MSLREVCIYLCGAMAGGGGYALIRSEPVTFFVVGFVVFMAASCALLWKEESP